MACPVVGLRILIHTRRTGLPTQQPVRPGLGCPDGESGKAHPVANRLEAGQV